MTAPLPSSQGWRIVALVLTALLVGLVIRHGADRRPADPSRPLDRLGTQHVAENFARPTLKLTSFNIHSGEGDGDVLDLNRTAEVLGDFDFAALYEVRGGLFESDMNSDQAAEIADFIRCGSIFAPTETHWWHEHFGNAVLSKWKLGPVTRIPLPGTRGKAFRNVVLTEFPWRDRRVRILSTHIDRQDDRERQLKLVTSLFLALEPPAVLMGDLNTTIADPLLADLRNHAGVRSPLHDVLGDRVPGDNIDWIFVRGLETVTAELVENSASDHPVLRTELALPPE